MLLYLIFNHHGLNHPEISDDSSFLFLYNFLCIWIRYAITTVGDGSVLGHSGVGTGGIGPDGEHEFLAMPLPTSDSIADRNETNNSSHNNISQQPPSPSKFSINEEGYKYDENDDDTQELWI